MNKTAQHDPRVDAYIAKAPEYSKPILTYLRRVVHSACPQVEETMKWSRPHFNYNGMLCGMSAFKEHCAFGFWKGSLLVKEGDNKNSDGMGQFGRITTVKDLPAKKQITGYIHAAMKLNDAGINTASRTNRKPRKPLPVPADLAAALKKNKAARATFANFSPSNQREYVEWLVEAKAEETRKRRLATTIEWLAEGKSRNWKYQTAKK
jgi:uncharacterized protein YdeI (YjbR/CyaY-like superfamily)